MTECYDPKVGRFVTKDPISFAGGDVNLYAYVKNNPVNWGDPEGKAYFGYRLLGSTPRWRARIPNPVDNALNTELVHEHIFYEDDKIPSNAGFLAIMERGINQVLSGRMILID